MHQITHGTYIYHHRNRLELITFDINMQDILIQLYVFDVNKYMFIDKYTYYFMYIYCIP